MGRLKPEFLERVEALCDRVLDVVQTLEAQRRSCRILDQISASGTSIGANIFEADEGLSRRDFCKCLGIAVKELNETRFWIRLVSRRGWIDPRRLEPLQKELDEVKKILGTILSRTRAVRPQTARSS